jgi:hypothetical protein
VVIGSVWGLTPRRNAIMLAMVGQNKFGGAKLQGRPASKTKATIKTL